MGSGMPWLTGQAHGPCRNADFSTRIAARSRTAGLTLEAGTPVAFNDGCHRQTTSFVGGGPVWTAASPQ